MSEQISSVDFDSQLQALSAVERRRLLYALSRANPDHGASVDVTELIDDSDLSVSMHHVHLPKLEDMGLVDVEQERQRVRRGEHFDEIEPLLRILDRHEDDLPTDWP